MGFARLDHFLASTALGVAALLTGCADNQESLIISHAPVIGDDCSVTSGSAVRNNGYLDTSFGTGFELGLSLVNQQPSNNSNNSGIDTSEVMLRDVDVSISIPQAPDIVSQLEAQNPAFVKFNSPLASVSIPGNGEQAIIVEVLTPPAVQALDGALNAGFEAGASVTLVVETVVRAERTGNSSGNIGVIESRSFSFPIRICSGCLIDCSACPNGVCPPDDTAYVGGVCGNAQDGNLTPSSCEDAN